MYELRPNRSKQQEQQQQKQQTARLPILGRTLGGGPTTTQKYLFVVQLEEVTNYSYILKLFL